MKKTIKCHIQAIKYSWADHIEFTCLPMPLGTHVQICEMDVEFDLPEDFSMEAGMIEVLKAEKEKEIIESHKKCARIDEQISKLQCLEMS